MRRPASSRCPFNSACTPPTVSTPGKSQPGKGKDPAPSSGYDEDAEKEMRDH